MSIHTFPKSICLVLAACALSTQALAEPAPKVLASWGDVQVTEEDLKRYVAFKLPDRDPVEVMTRPGVMEQHIQTLLMLRTLADRAEDEGLGLSKEQLEWQLRNQRNEWLVASYQRMLVDQSMEGVDWESLAQEQYKAEPELFGKPAQVDAAHILIRTEERTEDEALALAQEVYAKAQQEGADFTELAKQYSEGERVDSNGGELGTFSADRMVPPFSKAAFALQNPGDISEPVKTQFGYHVIKLNRHIEPQNHPFAAVKGTIIERLQKSMQREVIGDLLANARTDSTHAEVDEEAIEAFKKSLNAQQ
ncbi:peptidylprolyl isomerase [Gilvimarinus agarilyticus]|uniref:peptidylprolyl isomerase n=1 Tax=Gilvimarinus sp. 2_MG-2023 TaxID=3062666 RepID=UPI001C0979D5|nr:peptidylprolyl isomerase [Gilvimarinus sp. 2_MG-2023]MBU2887584.1 peptidylprolyl isomerase [Gilvimarinus agarilyticus]MDO6572235.1 peptidylprolyl isomerase [Gilvimarinus sp. 2_MG-2023]